MALSSTGNLKRIYLAVSAVLIIAVVYQVTREDALLQPNQQLEQMLNEPPQLSVDPAVNPVLANANSELARAQQALSPAVKSAPEVESVKVDDSIALVSDAWRMADATAATPTMPLPGGVSVYEPVAVDMENPAYPEAGQQTSVTLPGGERLQVNVKSSNTNPNGDYSWRGHLDGFGADEYPVVMTYGGNSVFATVTTPKGSYTLESVNGSGWIYKNPSEFELSHPGVNDFLEIPHDH